ncbi:hypothetical protein [Sorangium sp. So ce176]|uniref:hypothetical protein n=1 Tax=Sorangium sp. So ce176 TaxID=3133286 RepID=UPI003F649084
MSNRLSAGGCRSKGVRVPETAARNASMRSRLLMALSQNVCAPILPPPGRSRAIISAASRPAATLSVPM